MSTAVIRVLIVDDKIELRQNIKRLISFEETMEVAGEASNGQEAIDEARKNHPDIIIMDINMPVMDGIQATQIISQEMPEISVILMSVEGERDLIRNAMKAGARDFLVKPFSTEELFEGIKNIYKQDQKRRQLYNAPTPGPGQEQTGRGRRDQGQIITFFSTKGGVGKTSMIANLAVTLTQFFDARVGILDCDLQFGDTAIMMNLYPSKTLANLVEEPPPWSGDLIAEYMMRHEESGVDVLLSPSRPEYAEIVQVEHVEQTLLLLKDKYDFVLVDTVPLFRNIELSILDVTDRIMIVVTLELSAIKDVKLCLDLMANLNYPDEKITLLLNKGYPEVGGLSRDDVQAGLKRDVSVIFPNNEKEILSSINRGKPFMMGEGAENTDIGEAYVKLAGLLSGRQSAASADANEGGGTRGGVGFLQKLFGSK